MAENSNIDDASIKIVEVLGSIPEVEELPFSKYKKEVTFTLPYGSYLVGELLHPSPGISEKNTAFHIQDFKVNEDMRRNGIGKKLQEATAEYAKAHGAAYLYGMIQNAEALRSRASVFGRDNMSYFSNYLYGSDHNDPLSVTFDEVINKDYFPIYVVTDLTRIQSIKDN